jgi:hypothetical protein
VVEFYLKLMLILRIITYLTYICWEIDNFVIKSDIFRRLKVIFFNILKKLSCYHDNYYRYFMFEKYNGFVSKARVSECMYFLVWYIATRNENFLKFLHVRTREQLFIQRHAFKFCRRFEDNSNFVLFLLTPKWGRYHTPCSSSVVFSLSSPLVVFTGTACPSVNSLLMNTLVKFSKISPTRAGLHCQRTSYRKWAVL